MSTLDPPFHVLILDTRTPATLTPEQQKEYVQVRAEQANRT